MNCKHLNIFLFWILLCSVYILFCLSVSTVLLSSSDSAQHMNYSRMCYRFSILEWSQFSVLLVISISSVHLLSHLVSSTCFSTAECNQTNGGVKVYIQAPPHAVPWCLTDNNCFVGLVFVLGKRRRSDCWCFLLFYCIWKWLLSDSYAAVFDQYVFVLSVFCFFLSLC